MAESAAAQKAPMSPRKKLLLGVGGISLIGLFGWMGIIGRTVVGLVLLGSPLFVVIGGFALACFIAYPTRPLIFGESWSGTLENFSFIEPMATLAEQEGIVAIPFFMIAGAIMSRGEIANRLVAFANACLGWLPGGLALTTVLACMFFAAISGSSPVTVITIGAIMLPAMAAAGYDEKFSLGLVTSAGSLGIIIPPSIPMIVFAIFATQAQVPTDAGELFIAGIGPGFLLGGLMMAYCVMKGRKLPTIPFEFKKLTETLLDGLWALLFPVFILGGIYGGLFNPTEASAISVLLALLIELLIHRSIKPSEIPGILGEAGVLMGSILIIICVAFAFADFMAFHDVPAQIVRWLRSFDLTSVEFILMLNGMLIIVGCLMDIISAIILFVPLVMPIAEQFGFDPLHMGLIFIVNLEIGYLTPPLGLNLFVASTYFKKELGLVLKSVLPYLGLLLAGLALVTFVPTISTGFVNLKRDKPFWTEFPDTRLKADTTTEEEAEEDEDEDLEFRSKPKSKKGKGDKGKATDTKGDDGEKSLEELMNSDEFADEMGKDDDSDDDEDDTDADDGKEKSLEELMNSDEFAEEMGKDDEPETEKPDAGGSGSSP